MTKGEIIGRLADIYDQLEKVNCDYRGTDASRAELARAAFDFVEKQISGRELACRVTDVARDVLFRKDLADERTGHVASTLKKLIAELETQSEKRKNGNYEI